MAIIVPLFPKWIQVFSTHPIGMQMCSQKHGAKHSGLSSVESLSSNLVKRTNSVSALWKLALLRVLTVPVPFPVPVPVCLCAINCAITSDHSALGTQHSALAHSTTRRNRVSFFLLFLLSAFLYFFLFLSPWTSTLSLTHPTPIPYCQSHSFITSLSHWPVRHSPFAIHSSLWLAFTWNFTRPWYPHTTLSNTLQLTTLQHGSKRYSSHHCGRWNRRPHSCQRFWEGWDQLHHSWKVNHHPRPGSRFR